MGLTRPICPDVVGPCVACEPLSEDLRFGLFSLDRLVEGSPFRYIATLFCEPLKMHLLIFIAAISGSALNRLPSAFEFV